MSTDEVAREVLEALGGRENVLSNAVCMTRLRVTLASPHAVDYDALGDVHSVLGTAVRGHNGLEVVFGPRVIEGIYHSFTALTGIQGGVEDLFPMTRQDTNIRVQIHTTRKPKELPKAKADDQQLINDEEMSLLDNLFGTGESDVTSHPKAASYRLMVLNGPNINMLGNPLSGTDDASDDFPVLLELCKQVAEEAGFDRCDCFQSNHEGDLVDMIQDAFGVFDAIVINPGVYGSSSAIRDALMSVDIPTIEVHLKKLSRRDKVGTACTAMISGVGTNGYAKAIHELEELLGL